MAPEQFEGSHGVDHRADIYSLGVVFYEMLTGELPIGRFAPPSEKVEIDVRLDEVVLRTLEKEPDRRYQRASQIKSDVQSITSTDNPNLAPTFASEAKSQGNEPTIASAEQQDLAGRLLLTRRQLMERVENSLRPMFSGQFLRALVGGGTHCTRSAMLGTKYGRSASHCLWSDSARLRDSRDFPISARLHETQTNRLLKTSGRHSH